MINTTPASVCKEPNCLTHSGRPRQANRGCEKIPQQCASCCKANGGCKVHRTPTSMGHVSPLVSNVPLSLSIQSNPAPTLPSAQPHSTTHPSEAQIGKSPPAPRQYARPLDSKYANGYIEAHQRTYEAAKKFETDQRLNLVISNTVQVTLWTLVHFMLFQSLSFTNSLFRMAKNLYVLRL